MRLQTYIAILFVAAGVNAFPQSTNNLPPATTASSTNETRVEPSSSTAPAVDSHDFAAFRIIPERNIFNPNRTSRGAAPVKTDPDKPPRVDTFALLGTMIYEKGNFAFFDGSSSDYHKVLTPTNSIAGYTLKRVNPEGVQLEKEGKIVELGVGQQMKKQEEGEWTISAATVAAQPTNASNGSNTSTATSSGSENDVLKRLLEKREKELKK